MKEVKQAEVEGYAFDREEEMIGQVCVSSGVFNRSGRRLVQSGWLPLPVEYCPLTCFLLQKRYANVRSGSPSHSDIPN